MTENAIQEYLDLLDAQRLAIFAALDGLSEDRIWRRPEPNEWSAGVNGGKYGKGRGIYPQISHCWTGLDCERVLKVLVPS